MKTVDSVIDGLRLLRTYDEECHVGARSDMVWGPKVAIEDMDPEHVELLLRYDWFVNEQYGNWCIYCL